MEIDNKFNENKKGDAECRGISGPRTKQNKI